jgi:RND family efflux transporter MFP subunit
MENLFLKKVYMKRTLSMFFIAFIIVMAGCGEAKQENKDAGKEVVAKKEVESKTIKVEKLVKKEITKTVISNAEMEAKDEVWHTTKTGGDIEEVYYKNGDKVKKGELIVKMSDDNLEMSYKTAKANYNAAKSAYDQSKKFAEQRMKNDYAAAKASFVNAKESLDRAKRGADKEEIEQAKASVEAAKKNYEVQSTNYKKYQTLYEKKLVSEYEYLNVSNSYKSAESNYEQAKQQLEIILRGTDKEDIAKLEANLNLAKEQLELAKRYVDEKAWEYEITAQESQYKSAKSAYEYAKILYDDLMVTAKIDGIISNMDLTENTSIEKESALFLLINDNEMEGTTGISGRDLAGIDLGKEIRVYIEDLEKEYTAKITEISPTAEAQSKKFPVKFTIKNNGNIRKGMYARVYIPTITKETFVVPADAVVVRDLSNYIFIEKAGKAKKIRVKMGISNGAFQEVLSDSLNVGENVVVRGQFLLENDDSVVIE